MLTYRNVSRTISQRGPGIFNWDLSLFKNATIHEQFKAQFRLEALNAFNTRCSVRRIRRSAGSRREREGDQQLRRDLIAGQYPAICAARVALLFLRLHRVLAKLLSATVPERVATFGD